MSQVTKSVRFAVCFVLFASSMATAQKLDVKVVQRQASD